jgi:hypothetical protein
MPIAALLRETCSSSTGRSIHTRIKEFDELGNSTVSEQPILAVPRMSSGASFLVRSFRAHEGVIFWSYVSPIEVNPGADGILAALEELHNKQEAP